MKIVSTYTIAMIQMDIVFGNPEENRRRVREWFEKIKELTPKPNIVLLPELWDTGYDLKRLGEIADPDGTYAKEMLAELAQQYGVYLIGGSIAEQKAEGTYNTSFVFTPDGQLVHEYRKAHLFRLMEEEKYLQAGQELPDFRIGDMPAFLQICYDIRFPEGIRTGALTGAEVLFVVAEWPNPRLVHWRQLLIARAIENQMYVVACNRVGSDINNTFFGHSLIIDPWGEVIAEGGEEEGIVTGTISRELVADVRNRIPIFSDRRPHLYTL
ncbi:carbon-nitrogen family hydrolase [Aneurinibacillus aneurinilyticus]|nr:carbon-nitrogen family hydrolase [Aneurinibacillus aneurinilyticus]MCI1693746.1 carbon-nitrogen family hydrolase [Aneurinibacillus aneurinilyticus]MED0669501.1 carbon-nitrogen family hydrolase [Aneurinibacillus aneurinilyticus]MED0709069.1 carbon-nitrogen family hydrolase [Aneurinibacillus aneurinilyticus]MED0725463.1 carbon-nitrogen family hydrolase [Aneurinibacillus aneurinilyticus]MED0730774.1 carbon-nitrogen family hydrolase [Aneurinibacillus aneurinilyticus]